MIVKHLSHVGALYRSIEEELLGNNGTSNYEYRVHAVHFGDVAMTERFSSHMNAFIIHILRPTLAPTTIATINVTVLSIPAAFR